jgi:hypothetical protein
MKQRLPGTVFLFTGAAVVGLALLPASSEAGIVFTLGNNPQPGEQSVLNVPGSTGSPVFGTTSITGIPVQFTSTQTLFMPSPGNGPLEALSGPGGDQIGMHDVAISVPTHTVQDLIFNPSITGSIGAPGGNMDVFVTDNFGMVSSFEYALAAGDNFLTITTVAGERIASAVMVYSGPNGFTNLTSYAVSGIAIAVPEPASVVMMATGALPLVVLALLRRRRRRAAGAA